MAVQGFLKGVSGFLDVDTGLNVDDVLNLIQG
jgi:hypothetical protein